MIVTDYAGDPVDTREECALPGPFLNGLAVLLHFSDTEDESRGDFTMYGTGRRFGRRVLWCNTQGFMVTETFDTADAASAALNTWADYYETDEEDDQ